MPFWNRKSRKDTRQQTGSTASGEITDEELVDGATVTADRLWDTYKYNEVAKLVIRKKCKAMFHNGFSEVLDKAKLQELMRADLYKKVLGWSVVVIDAGKNIQAWCAYNHGVGAKVPDDDYDDFGRPNSFDIYTDESDNSKKTNVKGRGTKFFILRTFDGHPGWKGDSDLLALFKTLTRQEKILDDYGLFCYLWGKPLVHMQDKNATESGHLDDDLTDIKGKLKSGGIVVTDASKVITSQSLMSGAYDPINILNFQNGRIAGSSELNKTMLDGDPSGHLSSSEMALAAFYASIKEDQDEVLIQLLPILKALGLTDNIVFKDPSEFPPGQMAAFVRETVTVLKSLPISDKEIVDFVNNQYGTEFKIDSAVMAQKEEARKTLSQIPLRDGDKDEKDEDKEEIKDEKED